MIISHVKILMRINYLTVILTIKQEELICNQQLSQEH